MCDLRYLGPVCGLGGGVSTWLSLFDSPDNTCMVSKNRLVLNHVFTRP